MKKSYALVAIVFAIIIIALGGYNYYEFTNTGNMSISVSDLPDSNVTAVYITFTSVALHSNTSGWQNFTVGKTVNIYDLTTSNASLLVNISLHAGKYTMIRLYISNVVITISGKNYSFDRSAPFAFINHPFAVSAHSTTSLTIEFDLRSDLNLQSKIFTPYVGFTTG